MDELKHHRKTCDRPPASHTPLARSLSRTGLSPPRRSPMANKAVRAQPVFDPGLTRLLEELNKMPNEEVGDSVWNEVYVNNYSALCSPSDDTNKAAFGGGVGPVRVYELKSATEQEDKGKVEEKMDKLTLCISLVRNVLVLGRLALLRFQRAATSSDLVALTVLQKKLQQRPNADVLFAGAAVTVLIVVIAQLRWVLAEADVVSRPLVLLAAMALGFGVLDATKRKASGLPNANLKAFANFRRPSTMPNGPTGSQTNPSGNGNNFNVTLNGSNGTTTNRKYKAEASFPQLPPEWSQSQLGQYHVLRLAADHFFYPKWRVDLAYFDFNTFCLDGKAYKTTKTSFWLQKKSALGLVFNTTSDSQIQGREAFVIEPRKITYFCDLQGLKSDASIQKRVADLGAFIDFVQSNEYAKYKMAKEIPQTVNIYPSRSAFLSSQLCASMFDKWMLGNRVKQVTLAQSFRREVADALFCRLGTGKLKQTQPTQDALKMNGVRTNAYEQLWQANEKHIIGSFQNLMGSSLLSAASTGNSQHGGFLEESHLKLLLVKWIAAARQEAEELARKEAERREELDRIEAVRKQNEEQMNRVLIRRKGEDSDALSPIKGEGRFTVDGESATTSPLKKQVSMGDQSLLGGQSISTESGLDRFANNGDGNKGTDRLNTNGDFYLHRGVDFDLRGENMYRSSDFDPMGILTEEKSVAGDLRTFINFIFVRNIHRMIALPWPDLLQGNLLVASDSSKVRKTQAGVWEYKCDFSAEGGTSATEGNPETVTPRLDEGSGAEKAPRRANEPSADVLRREAEVQRTIDENNVFQEGLRLGFSLAPRIVLEYWFRLKCTLQGNAYFGDIVISSWPSVTYSPNTEEHPRLSGTCSLKNRGHVVEIEFLNGYEVMGRIWDKEQNVVESMFQGNIFEGVRFVDLV